MKELEGVQQIYHCDVSLCNNIKYLPLVKSPVNVREKEGETDMPHCDSPWLMLVVVAAHGQLQTKVVGWEPWQAWRLVVMGRPRPAQGTKVRGDAAAQQCSASNTPPRDTRLETGEDSRTVRHIVTITILIMINALF